MFVSPPRRELGYLTLLLLNSVAYPLSSDVCPSVCGGDTQCSVHSRSPVPTKSHKYGKQVVCRPGQFQHSSPLGSGLHIPPGATSEVIVVDDVTGGAASSNCASSSLLAAVTYWCQGKSQGCRLPPSVLLSALPPECEVSLGELSLHWHHEPDYSSTEIPCPTYTHRRMSKKYIPLENTCYLKTGLAGSWAEARAQCWAWGGELALPLTSNTSTPNSWLQDDEEVWLGGGAEYHARPILSHTDQHFQEGTFMACFSDLWRCTDHGGPYSDPGCDQGRCQASRRGLCAIPPRRQEPVSPPCPATADWPATPPGTGSHRACPPGQQGEVVWSCGSWGLRDSPTPDHSNCSGISSYQETLDKLKSSELKPVEVLENLNVELETSRSGLGTGDIGRVLTILSTSLQIQAQAGEEEVDQGFVSSSLQTLNNLVSNPEAWHYLDEEKNSENVNNVQNIADITSDYLVRENWEDGNQFIEKGTDKIKFEVKKINVSEVQKNDDWSKISLKIQENKDIKETNTKVVLKSFENLGCIINGQRSCDIPNDKKKNQVNSRVVGADVYENNVRRSVSNISVEITFEHIFSGLEYSLSSVECVFWDSIDRAWNRSGCETLETGEHRTRCQCGHLTNFAVLMDISSVFSEENGGEEVQNNGKQNTYLSYLTIVCSSISIIFLTMSLWIFCCVPSLKGDSATIHSNLCGCLLAAHLLLLVGLDATAHSALCHAIAVTLHFLFLASFCWMLAEGLHIYKLLTDVWRTNRLGIIPYYITGYLLPLVMVIISIICNEALDLRGYGTPTHCWLSPEQGFIWAFMGPVAAIVSANIVIFIIAMLVARRAISNNKNMDTATEILTQIKGGISLVSILGLSWVSGFLYFSSSLSWMGAVFTLTNSSQGLMIFICHVILNDKVRSKLVSYLRRRFQVIHEDALSRTDTTKRTMRRNNLNRNDTEISIMDSTSGAQSEVITTGQDENMNQPDKIEMETQKKT